MKGAHPDLPQDVLHCPEGRGKHVPRVGLQRPSLCAVMAEHEPVVWLCARFG